MRRRIILLIGFCLTLLYSCSKMHEKSSDNAGYYEKSESEVSENAAGSVEGTQKNKAESSNIALAAERKLIKNGSVSFKTKKLSDTKQAIQKALKQFNGYIAKEDAYDYSDNPSEELVVRVPANKFDAFLDAVLTGVDELDGKRIDIEDVSEKFIDIEARLKNKKQLETKYQELLLKAGDMETILKIEKEISLIREDIEATEGRLRYLSNQVQFSTLNIRYYEKRSSGFNFGGKLGSALSSGGTGFLWFLIVLVQLWPLWLIGGLIWWFILRLIKRKREVRK